MYHSIGNEGITEEGAQLYAVTLDNFRKQMEYIVGTVPLQGLRVSPLRGQTLQIGGDSPCVITFDDGLIDNYTNALPILKEFGLTAYFFILVGKIGTSGYMSWGQIKELLGAGMVVGSHGMTHRILTVLSGKELDYELRESKKILEDNLGCAVDYFSVPRGFCNKRILEKAKELGYKAIFTSNPKDSDGYKFGRIPVRGNWSLGYFIRVLNNGLSFRDKTEELIKKSSKRILGAGYYDKIRTKILKK